VSKATDKTIALNVRLKPSEPSAHPRATRYTNVGVAQGSAYVDFGFIAPVLLAAIAKTAKDGPAAPKGFGQHARHPRGHGWCCPADWPQWVDAVELEEQIEAVRKSVTKGQPYGSEPWVEQVTGWNLGATVRARGRLKKELVHNSCCPFFWHTR
jgi:hypothetical protein